MSKKVLCTIHHIDENKLNHELSDFKNRDKFVNTYHVTNEKTATQLEDLTKKKIVVEPFWINSNNWNIINNKNQLREKYKINKKTCNWFFSKRFGRLRSKFTKTLKGPIDF